MNIKKISNFIKDKRILHTTHYHSDCDGIASVYWGINIFGGDYYIPTPELRSAEGVIEYLQLNKNNIINFDYYDYYFIYDTSNTEDINFLSLNNKKYIVFDHHPNAEKSFVKNAYMYYINPMSANVINLYDLSIQNLIDLDEKILMSFSIALYTDTLMLRTARSNEFKYFSKFIGKHNFEDILNIIYSKSIEENIFFDTLSNIKIYWINNLKVSIGEFENINLYQAFLDSIFNVLNIDVSIGILPLGIKLQVKKIHVQKIYHKILVPIQRKLKIKRKHGIWIDFFDYNLIIKELSKYNIQ
ncbi:hypothetical protein JCM30566_14620 [Marinitoga arctica]